MQQARGKTRSTAARVQPAGSHDGRQVYRRAGVPAAPSRRPARPAPRRAVVLVSVLLVLFLGGLAVTGLVRLLGGPAAGSEGLGGYLPAVATRAGADFVVLLDAGHGAHDSGTTSTDGLVEEKDLTLEMAQRVGALLARHGNVQVVYTREDDSFLTPKERGEMSRTVGADLLLSLHFNADQYSTSVRGFQVFAQPPRHGQHEGSMAAARALVSRVSSLGLPVLGDSGIYYMFYRSEYDNEPYDSTWYIPEEELRNDTYGVLQNAVCPALLVEQWYLTNTQDMALMNNETGKSQMALALYQTVCETLGLDAMAV